MDKPVIKTAIIGLDRLSTSMGMAMRAHNQEPDAKIRFEITGQDAEGSRVKKAQSIGAIDATNSNARSAANNADMVIMSLPLGVRDDVFEYLAEKLKPGAVVLDMSTSKVSLIELAKNVLPRSVDGKPQAYLVGIRPVVNNVHLFSAQNSLDDASEKMFAGGEMIIAPDASVPQEAVKLATDLAEILLMTPHFMQPDEFDAIAGFTEDLPALLGIALFASMRASQGVDDMERSINPTMGVMFAGMQDAVAQDMIAQWAAQSDYTQQRIDELIAMLNHLKDLIASDDAEDFFRDIIPKFDIWLEHRRSGRWEARGPDLSQVRQSSMFSNLFGMGMRRSGKPDKK